jgi:hypothetical protein
MNRGDFRFIVFGIMALLTGLIASVSTPAAATSVILVFGYGISEICDAIRERR